MTMVDAEEDVFELSLEIKVPSIQNFFINSYP